MPVLFLCGFKTCLFVLLKGLFSCSLLLSILIRPFLSLSQPFCSLSTSILSLIPFITVSFNFFPFSPPTSLSFSPSLFLHLASLSSQSLLMLPPSPIPQYIETLSSLNRDKHERERVRGAAEVKRSCTYVF